MTVPYTFGTATSSIPLSQLDSNFNTPITLGNTAVYLGNTTTTLNALTLSNVTITSGNVTITGVTVGNVNVTSTLTLSGLTASTALALDASKNVVSVTNTGSGNNVLATSPTLTTPNLGTPSALTLTNATGLPLSTGVTGTLSTANGGTGLTSFTANGILYASSTSALATGSALTFDGSSLTVFGGGAIKGNKNASGQFLAFVAQNSTQNYGTYIDQDNAGSNSWSLFDTTNSQTALRYYPSTSGYWQFYVNNSEQMRLTSTGLGIGTSSPQQRLHVQDSTANNGTMQLGGTTYYGTIKHDGVSTGAMLYNIASASGGGHQFLRGGTLQFMTDSSGNLGLGVTPSAWNASNIKALQIVNGGFANNGGSGYITNNAFYTGSYVPTYISSSAAQMISFNRAGNNDIQFLTAPSGTAGNAITFSQVMTLDASGNWLLGQTSSIYSAVGRASAEINGSLTAIYALNIANSNAGYVYHDGTDMSVLNYKNGALKFSTNNAERARIDSSGNFYVGATSGNPNPGIKLSPGFNAQITIGHDNTSGSGQYYMPFYFNGTLIGGITQNGTTAVAYNTTSDYRLKNNQAPLTGSGAFIDALQPKTWTWAQDGSKGAGFIAHEFAEVSPSSVVGEKDAVDTEGNPVYQAMQASSPEVIANLVAEIQSLRKRLAAAGIA